MDRPTTPPLTPPIRIAKVTNIIRKSTCENGNEGATPRTKPAMQSLMELSSSNEKKKQKRDLQVDTSVSSYASTPHAKPEYSPSIAIPVSQQPAPLAVPIMNMYPELMSVMQVAQSPSEMQMVQKAFFAGLQSETHTASRAYVSPISTAYVSHPATPSPSGTGGYFSPSPGSVNTTPMLPQQQQMAYATSYPCDMNAIRHAQYLSNVYNAQLSRAYMHNAQVGETNQKVNVAQPLIQTGVVLEVYWPFDKRWHVGTVIRHDLQNGFPVILYTCGTVDVLNPNTSKDEIRVRRV